MGKYVPKGMRPITDREQEIYARKQCGQTYRTIANECGINLSAAQYAVSRVARWRRRHADDRTSFQQEEGD